MKGLGVARIWRFFVALCDWRTWLRVLSGRPVVDVVFITNMRDEVDRKRFLGNWVPPEGHFNGPRYWFGGIAARTRALNMTAKDLMTRSGRKEAKKQFISAVRWAQGNGARVVLLAAGTKRLFGPNGEALKGLFPNIFFSIGDNGTTWLLRSETLRALRSAGLVPGAARVCVIGPTGFLGGSMVDCLSLLGYNVVGLCGSQNGVEKAKVKAYASFDDVGEVDAVIACTHSDEVRLTLQAVETLRRKGRKLLVVDVAEPANMSRESYKECRSVVIRQDAGNAFSPRLRYVLGAASYKLFRLTRGVTFGCFAEALTLGAELVAGNRAIGRFDGFSVSEENIQTVEGLFAKHGFGIPSPRCFGSPVESFCVGFDAGTVSGERIALLAEA